MEHSANKKAVAGGAFMSKACDRIRMEVLLKELRKRSLPRKSQLLEEAVCKSADSS